MDRIRAGDPLAESELYVRHVRAAVRHAQGHGAQPADAEDFVHEAFLRVLQQLRRGRQPRGSFRSYLQACVRNVASDAHRGQRGREAPSDDEAMLRHQPGLEVDPQMLVEVRGTVHTAMGELPQRWRDVLWCIHVEGRTPAAIAAREGATAQAVSALGYRALKALRGAHEVAVHCDPDPAGPGVLFVS